MRQEVFRPDKSISRYLDGPSVERRVRAIAVIGIGGVDHDEKRPAEDLSHANRLGRLSADGDGVHPPRPNVVGVVEREPRYGRWRNRALIIWFTERTSQWILKEREIGQRSYGGANHEKPRKEPEEGVSDNVVHAVLSSLRGLVEGTEYFS